jgi:predicted MFS family arabinose efflux permease
VERKALGAALGGMLALAVAMGIGRFAYTPALALMQRDLGLTVALAGRLASLNYAGYLLGAMLAAAVPSGRRRAPFLLSLLASVATTGFMALSSDPLLWAILRFFSGVASAFLFVLTSGMALDSFGTDGRGRGILYSGVGGGIALSGILAGAGDALGGWSGAWAVFGSAALLLSVPAAFLLREPTSASRATAPGPPAPLPFGTLLAAYFCAGLGYIVTGTFLVAIAERLPEVAGTGNALWTAVGLAAIPSCTLWARLGVRWGMGRALAAAFLLQAAGIALPAAWTSIPSFVLGSLLYGGTFMGIVLLTMSLGKLALPGDSGRAVGLLTAVYGIGQIIGPWLAGVGAEAFGSFTIPLLGAAGLVLAGGLLLVLALSKKPSSPPAH